MSNYYPVEELNADQQRLVTYPPARGVVVKLKHAEVLEAAHVGVQRQTDNIFRKIAHKSAGFDASILWQNHIEGALGERVVAKYTGEPWDGAPGNYKADDVAQLQVRLRSRLHYDLVIKPHDREDRPFLLVLGSAPIYWIVGWIMGGEGKQQRWWRDPTNRIEPRFYVPQSELHDLATLPGYEHRWQIVLDWRAKRAA